MQIANVKPRGTLYSDRCPTRFSTTQRFCRPDCPDPGASQCKSGSVGRPGMKHRMLRIVRQPVGVDSHDLVRKYPVPVLHNGCPRLEMKLHAIRSPANAKGLVCYGGVGRETNGIWRQCKRIGMPLEDREDRACSSEHRIALALGRQFDRVPSEFAGLAKPVLRPCLLYTSPSPRD